MKQNSFILIVTNKRSGRNGNKKIVVLSSILSLLGTMVVPTAQAFASQTQSESSFQENEGYFLDERNQHFMTVVDTIRSNGNSALADDLYSFFNGKIVTSQNRDQLVLEFEDYYNRRPQTRAAMSTVLATIAAAMAVTRGMYEAGYYAARQLHTRGMLTKDQYKPNGGWWMAGIAVAFGIPASLGFDDYMYNR